MADVIAADVIGSDVIVVGAGVIGLSIAWQAASCGADVTVVDPRPGRGASWAAAGMLAPVGEAHFGEGALTRLNLEAARAWPRFADDLERASGLRLGYLTGGTLLVAVDGSDREAVDDLLAFRLDSGLSARRLSGTACRQLEPLLSPGIRGGAELADDHQVDNRAVVEALVAALHAQKVRVVEEEAAAVDVERGVVRGVTLASRRRLAAPSVVVAAGCRSGRLDGIPHPDRPPVRPVKGLTLRLRGPNEGPALQRTVRGMVHGRSCYLVPRRDGHVVVGATVEERGFDTAVQAGAVHDLLADARSLVPAVDEYELVDTTTGLRPGSPDNAPIVGRTAVTGLLVATGHYRNGILLAPITAAAVVALLLGTEVPPLGALGALAPFGPDRFAGAR